MDVKKDEKRSALGESVRLRHVGDDDAPVLAVQVAALDALLVDVGPVEAPVGQVDGQAVDATDAADQRQPLAAVQRGAFDVRHRAPHAQVHVALARVQSDAARVLQILIGRPKRYKHMVPILRTSVESWIE